MIAALLEYLSIAVLTFGAMALIWFAWSYWQERRSHSVARRLFTLLCAGASALAAAYFLVYRPLFEYAQDLLAGIVPPLVLHLAIQRDRIHDAAWHVMPAARYFSTLTPPDDPRQP